MQNEKVTSGMKAKKHFKVKRYMRNFFKYQKFMKNILTQYENTMMKIFKKRHRDCYLFTSSKAFIKLSLY